MKKETFSNKKEVSHKGDITTKSTYALSIIILLYWPTKSYKIVSFALQFEKVHFKRAEVKRKKCEENGQKHY